MGNITLQNRTRASILSVLLLACSTNVDYAQAIYARSEIGESPPTYCTVFHHMVKSAGSTVKSILRRASVVDGVAKPVSCARAVGHDPECMEGLKYSPVLSGYGELIRDPLQQSGRQCEYFTMMREPIDRLVSAFFYCPTDHDIQSRPPQLCGHYLSEIPATERLVEFTRTLWKNQAFRQMTFGIQCPANLVCEDSLIGDFLGLNTTERAQMLSEAEGRLATYAAVGIVEYYELSMNLFNARVRSPVRDWRSVKKVRNPGEGSSTRDKVLEWARTSSEIQSLLEADLTLYSFAVGVFKRQTAEALGTVWQK